MSLSCRAGLVFAALLACLSGSARAVEYEVFVDIETEEDLYDLRVSDQLSEGSFAALLLLYQTKVDLNRADRDRLYALPNLDLAQVDRILAYRDTVGSIVAVDDLMRAGVLEPALAESIRPFVVVRAPSESPPRARGFARLQTRWSGKHDRLPPSAALQARLRSPNELDVGVLAVLTRTDVGRARWEPGREALYAAGERVRFVVPKLYLQWESESWAVVAGTYRIGFGQRLTFDVTDQINPNGFFGDYELRRSYDLVLGCRRAAGELFEPPCPSDVVTRITPDYRWTNRLTGLAIGARTITKHAGWLQAYAWGSYQVDRVPRFEVRNRAQCPDPRRDDDPACRAPPVYIGGDPRDPAPTFTAGTLPRMVVEALGGANVSYFWDRRVHVGLTGYGAVPRWLVDGVALDYQESARKPFGGPFGALGIDFAHGAGVHDLFGELTRSFDAQSGGGGGYGAVVRSVTALPAVELDVSARYYGVRFSNPYARPISAPDELEGLRARDEAGARWRTTAELGPRLGLRTLIDLWRRLSRRAGGSLAFARLDIDAPGPSKVAWWASYRSAPRAWLTAARYAYAVGGSLAFAIQYQHEWLKQVDRGGPRQDMTALVELATRPTELFRLRLRIRYDFEDILDNQRHVQALWGYVETMIALRDRGTLRLRYDSRVFLDGRPSTLTRQPNPEHWLSIELAFAF